MKKYNFTIKSIWISILFSFYFFFILNFSLIQDFYQIFILERSSIFFIISVPIFFLAVFNLVFTPFTFRFITKPFFIVLIFVSSIVNFASFHYQTIFDREMIANIFETNSSEVLSYLNFSLYVWIFFTGIIPIVILLKTKILYPSFIKDIAHKIASMVISILVIALIVLLFYKNYAAVGRNNNTILYKVNPTYYVSSTVKYIKQSYFYTQPVYKTIGTDARKTSPEKKDLLIFILGETARSQNYQLNGYEKETNYYSQTINNLISFKNVYSCGTATAVSVPCMFSMLSKKDHSRVKSDFQDNVIDILKYAGMHLFWMENNSDCKGVCKNIEFIEVSKLYPSYCEGKVCTDDIFLEQLGKTLNSIKETGGILFMHFIGSHGPTYYKRVPEQMKRFKPECPRSDIQNCSNEEIINTYDNTILFTDFVMTEIIKHLNQDKYTSLNPALLYVSDHGESLGEKGIFLHGMPYAIAPEEQIKVPMILWLSDAKIKNDKIDFNCLKERADYETFSHDNLSHSLLGLMNVTTSAKNEKLDLVDICKN